MHRSSHTVTRCTVRRPSTLAVRTVSALAQVAAVIIVINCILARLRRRPSTLAVYAGSALARSTPGNRHHRD